MSESRMDNHQPGETPEPKPCWNCGGTDWQSGVIERSTAVGFKPDDKPFFTIAEKLEIRGQVCVNCGLLVTFLDGVGLGLLQKWRERSSS